MVQKKNNAYIAITAKIMVSLLIASAIFLTTLIAILHSSYGWAFLQRSIERATDFRIQSSVFSYDFKNPFAFYFKDLIIESQSDQTQKIEEINLTVAPFRSLLTASLVLEDAWIKGTSISKLDNTNFIPASLSVNELSLEKVNILLDEVTINNADIQLSNWQNDQFFGKSTGSFMFSAQSAKFAQEDFYDILLSGTRQEHEWQLWNASLSSNFGEVKAIASFANDQLTFDELSLSDAKIQPVQSALSQAFYAKLNPWLEKYQINIERLDLLNMTAVLEKAKIEHLNLTAYNIVLQKGLLVWQEDKQTEFSFNTEALHLQQLKSFDLLGNIAISKQGVNISSLTGKLADEGFIAIEGEISPKSIDLKQFSVNGISYALNALQVKTLEDYLKKLESVNIDKLAVKRTNLSIEESDFPLNIKGIDIKGKDIGLQKQQDNKIWQGELSLKAASAMVNQIQMLNPVVKATVKDNQWQLSSELPIEKGLLKLTGLLNTHSASHPWKIQGEGLAIPNQIYQQWFDAKLPVLGEHDIEIDLYGLSITQEAMRYSLSGSLSAKLYNAKLASTQDTPLIKELADFFAAHHALNQDVSPDEAATQNDGFETAEQAIKQEISLKAGRINFVLDRGQITLNPTPISTDVSRFILQGNWDYVTRQGGFSTKSQNLIEQ